MKEAFFLAINQPESHPPGHLKNGCFHLLPKASGLPGRLEQNDSDCSSTSNYGWMKICSARACNGMSPSNTGSDGVNRLSVCCPVCGVRNWSDGDSIALGRPIRDSKGQPTRRHWASHRRNKQRIVHAFVKSLQLSTNLLIHRLGRL